MRFFGALLLIFVLSLKEIEASNFYKGIITAIDSIKRQEDRRAIVSTPRPARGQAPARNPASLGQQALDLHEYSPHILESSEQPDVTLRLGYTPTDTSDVGSSSTRMRGSSARGASSTGRIQNDQIPYQVQGYQQQGYQQQGYHQQGYQQQYLQENSAWFNHHHATTAIPAPQYGDISLGPYASYQNPNDGTSNMPSNIPTQQTERKLSKKEMRDMVRSELAARREQQIWEAEMAYQYYNSHHPYGYSNAPHPWDHSGGPGSGTQY